MVSSVSAADWTLKLAVCMVRPSVDMMEGSLVLCDMAPLFQ